MKGSFLRRMVKILLERHVLQGFFVIPVSKHRYKQRILAVLGTIYLHKYNRIDIITS